VKRVLITGAAKGIGLASARAFKSAGFDVIITYLNTLPKNGFESYRVDGRNSSEVNNLCEKLAREGRLPDILINNAGICQVKQLQDITDFDWHNMIDSNLSSAFYYARAFGTRMLERKSGLIINVASIWGETGASCESHYSASKAALIALSKSLDDELSLSGVRVKYIAPAAVETDMLKGYTIEDRRFIEEELGKIKSPKEIALMLLKLAE